MELLNERIWTDSLPATNTMLEKCPNFPTTTTTTTPHSFQAYPIWLQVADPGALSKFGCAALDSFPPLLSWIHLLTGPSREEPGAGLG